MKRSFFINLEGFARDQTLPLNKLIDELAFNEQGLMPAIIQDADSDEVLMLAWMNKLSLEQTLATGRMTYWSRSRGELWIKGATSGHWQQMQSLRIDCDGDALLCRVIQQGAACHTGRKSCFYIEADPDNERAVIISSAYGV
ncbi:MAG TPA: phosphoribosyl-AMP cyclohydrolase [Porticoccaceae bacterium]|nr:phosphoribosyl-AMP cyclohydrolase [Porticoccaceae bacterium]